MSYCCCIIKLWYWNSITIKTLVELSAWDWSNWLTGPKTVYACVETSVTNFEYLHKPRQQQDKRSGTNSSVPVRYQNISLWNDQNPLFFSFNTRPTQSAFKREVSRNQFLLISEASSPLMHFQRPLLTTLETKEGLEVDRGDGCPPPPPFTLASGEFRSRFSPFPLLPSPAISI